MIPRMLTIHCSDSPNGGDVTIVDIRAWHIARGWKDVGYHMVILPSGEVQNGRALNEIGAHVEGHNDGNVGICLVGKDKFSPAAFKALRSKIDSLRMTYNIPKDQIWCHYQFDTAIKQGKTCPNMISNKVLLWYSEQDDRYIQDYFYVEHETK